MKENYKGADGYEFIWQCTEVVKKYWKNIIELNP